LLTLPQFKGGLSTSATQFIDSTSQQSPRDVAPETENMKRTLLRITVLVLMLSPFAAWAEATRWETLRAINLVENPRNSPRPGSHGELGPYQFKRATWHQHTRKPFSLAVERAHADEVAVLHYEWLRRGLIRNGIEPSAYNISLAWNAGLSAVVNNRVPARTHRYAEQVVNIVAEIQRTTRRVQVAQATE
jgi:hypothetical protein